MHGTLSLFRAATGIVARARTLFGIDDVALSFEALQREAARRTGIDAPSSEAVAPAFARLAAALEAEADLDAFGRLAAANDLLGKLRNLLLMDAAERRDPSISRRAIRAPIVITGLPRSGTTFLHALLARHPALLAPRTWQTIEPFGPDPAASRDRVARQLRFFGHLVPELASLHPLSAERPQECSEIMGHVFRSLRFETTFDIPSYRDWVRADGLAPAYAFHRRFLRHLQGDREDARWVLKSPDHALSLAALRCAYPDAHLVFVHRDPLRVLASVARLTELLRTPFARGVDRAAIGRQVLEDWTAGMRAIIDAADDPAIVHVRHDALVRRPIETARTVLGQAGLGFDGAAEAAIGALVASQPDGGYGRNHYALESYGVSPAEIAAIRSEYLDRFAVAETEP